MVAMVGIPLNEVECEYVKIVPNGNGEFKFYKESQERVQAGIDSGCYENDDSEYHLRKIIYRNVDKEQAKEDFKKGVEKISIPFLFLNEVVG